MTAVSVIGIAAFAHSWTMVLTLMAVAGIGNALSQPAGNQMIADRVPAEHFGASLGWKQAAPPFATLLAGLSVPVLSLRFGWRWAFVVGGLFALAVAAAGLGMRQSTPAAAAFVVPRSRYAGLALLAAASFFGASAGNALTAFYVRSAVDRHISVGIAGTLLAVGGLTGVLARVILGHWIDRGTPNALFPAVGLLTFGAIGAGFLGSAQTVPVLALVTIAVYATGWGWSGLVTYALVSVDPRMAAESSAVNQMGVFAGGACGPFAFGLVAEHYSYTTGWWMTSIWFLAAAVLLWRAARGWFLPRPLLEPSPSR
jgi:MFS family permease